jgi:hypothetical protein
MFFVMSSTGLVIAIAGSRYKKYSALVESAEETSIRKQDI